MAAARRNRRHRRNRGLLGPLFKVLCALAVLTALTFGVTVFFQVETVTVSGNARYTQEEIIQASGIQPGDNLYRFNKRQVSDRILQGLPYTKEVSINRKLPSTVAIAVTEWDAVARIEPSAGGSVPAAPEGDASSGDTSGGGSSSSSGEAPLEVAREAWLISPPGPAGCKLLEPAPAEPDSEGPAPEGNSPDGAVPGGGQAEGKRAIPVTGLAAVLPRAGTMLAVAQEEQPKLDALEGLLGELDSRGELDKVSSIELGSTQVVMRWLDRFDVKMALNADFHYDLRALEESIKVVEKEQGEGAAGTLDLTGEKGKILYSPEQEQQG